MSEGTTNDRWLARAIRRLAALPYVAGAETTAPDYWALPATGGYEHGYARGAEMAEACLLYLRRCAVETTDGPRGHIHLFKVISRIAVRLRTITEANGTGEAAMTINGHLAGFCGGIEAYCRGAPAAPGDGQSADDPMAGSA